MLTVRTFDPAVGNKTGGAELLGTPAVTWVDVFEPDEATLNMLGEKYGLHRLAIEDCLHLDQRPKLEDYGAHQFIVLQGFSCKEDGPLDLQLHEMHFFLGANWLITVHQHGHAAIDDVTRRVDGDPLATLGKGADFVAYLVADALVDRNFPLLDRFADDLETLEQEIFERPGQAHLERAFGLKRALVQVRRVLSPQRDVVGLLARHGIKHVQERTTLYFRDVYDHLVRLYEQIDANRDLLGNAMDAYLTVMANRTNEITKQLTVFASLFLPLSFVVGFFGQNFDGLTKEPAAFWVMVALLVSIPAGMFFWFRRKEWL